MYECTVTPQLIPAVSGPLDHLRQFFAAIDGPPGPSMAAIDGLPCHKWSPRFFNSTPME